MRRSFVAGRRRVGAKRIHLHDGWLVLRRCVVRFHRLRSVALLFDAPVVCLNVMLLAATWGGSGPPVTGDAVIVSGAVTVTLDASFVGNVSLVNGATLDCNGGSLTATELLSSTSGAANSLGSATNPWYYLATHTFPPSALPRSRPLRCAVHSQATVSILVLQDANLNVHPSGSGVSFTHSVADNGFDLALGTSGTITFNLASVSTDIGVAAGRTLTLVGSASQQYSGLITLYVPPPLLVSTDR